MKNIIVGLGNAGEKYQGTRHNVGMDMINKLVDEFGGEMLQDEKQYKTSKIIIEGKEVLLVMSKEYMNTTGQSLKKVITGEGIENLIVIQDDTSIELGKCKLVYDRGHAGHNGIKNIFDILGNRDFYRIRVGVGSPASNQDDKDFVLGKLNKAEMDIVNNIYKEKVIPTMTCILISDTDKAFQVCNTN